MTAAPAVDAATYLREVAAEMRERAAHIATWEPDVARAVAGLLNQIALIAVGCPKSQTVERALDVAHTFNRAEVPSDLVPCDVVPREATA